MKFFAALLAAALPATAAAKAVVAHVIVGNTFTYTVDQWESDISLAQEVGIDAFALNVGTPLNGDNGCATQVANAFEAANAKGFKVFLMFDYLGGSAGAWAASDVVTVMQTYAENGAMFTFNGAPLVSTFEGDSNLGDWSGIRSQVSTGITFMPVMMGLGPSGLEANIDLVDGFFSWDMWPKGPSEASTASDQTWRDALGGKPYMMGVSPWFFTDLPAYNKAWVWRGDHLWQDRWEDVISFQPDIVQIVTWNDYGESHYVGPIWSDGIPSATNADAHSYVDNMPHDDWRQLLPYFINQYKTGSTTVDTEKLVYWYRLTPGAAGSNNGVTGNDCASAINTFPQDDTCYDPNVICEDEIFFTALIGSVPATITVQVGDNAVTSYTVTSTGAFHTSQPFNGQTGAVQFQLQRSGSVVLNGTGEAILASPADGITNYNAWVGGVSA